MRSFRHELLDIAGNPAELKADRRILAEMRLLQALDAGHAR